MAELVALGFVTYDPKAKIYGLAGTMKKVFQSKHDYNLALKHSKNLVFSTSEKQRFDQMDPFLALDLLAFHDVNTLCPDVDNECFVQHLRTGYFNDVYVLMQKYRKLMDETGFSKYPGFPKHFSSFEEVFGSAAAPQELVSRAAAHKEAPHTAEGKVKEIEDLRNLLVGKIYSIVNDVANGVPLRGYCEYCPDRKVTIKSKS